MLYRLNKPLTDSLQIHDHVTLPLMHTPHTVLYSFRRCPYAMRARMALRYAGIAAEIREVDLKNKPSHLLAMSPKGTVPVLILANANVIDESLDIMYWALKQNDPDHWVPSDEALLAQSNQLISENDTQFAPRLTRYKYADRYPEQTARYYRQEAEVFVQQLDALLAKHEYLLANQLSLVDIALLPFVRQFAETDRPWFNESPYQNLRGWLDKLLHTELFLGVMRKI